MKPGVDYVHRQTTTMKTKTKVCSSCGRPKSLSSFHNDPKGREGKRSQCKQCVSSYNKKRRLQKEDEILKLRIRVEKEVLGFTLKEDPKEGKQNDSSTQNY